MHNVILLLGTNMGDRVFALCKAEESIAKSIGKIIKRSKIYETASWGIENLPSFLNQVLEVETGLSPVEIMHKILQIEEIMGRKRDQKWQSRIIDIDILFFDNEVINLPALTIPHPYLHERKFTLVPLVEINPLKVHPVFKKSLQQLLNESNDSLAVTEYIAPLAIK